MRKITLLVLFCCTHLMMLAQTKSTNTNEAPARVKCYTTEYMAELRRANPRMQTDEQFEQFMAAAIAKRKSDIERGVVQPLAGPYVINVIVHVIHDGQAVGTYPNLLQRQVASQIRVLNEDFNRTNADAANTPAVFAAVAGSVGGTAPAGGGIEFRLARQDPAGNLLQEAGVHRYQVASQTTYSTTFINGTIKPATSWDNSRYMNIWTIKSPVSGTSALYGYAQFPDGSGLAGLSASGGASNTDGLVIAADAFGSNYDAFGTILPVGQRFQFSAGADKGRTATHELGHGLGLRHIWGDNQPSCGDDFCADTPTATGPNYNACYNSTAPGQFHPKANTCGTTDEMFENFMDYVLDGCMNIFTQDQMTRMVTVMNVSPGRSTLTAATVGNCPAGAIGLTRAAGAYPAAGVGQSYTQTNVGTGGGTPNPATGAGYVYTLTSGTLPAGLTLNTSTGVISGVASATGTFSFSITPSGASGVNAAGASTACTGSAVTYSIQVVASTCPAITILPATGALPNAAPGVAYSQQITASGGVGAYTYSISSGALPTGFSLNATTGFITSTTATTATVTPASFTVLATDATTPVACQALINYTLAVVAPPCVPPTITTYPYTQNFDGITTPAYSDPPDATLIPTSTFPTNTNLPCGWIVNNVNNDDRSWANYSGTIASSPTNAAVYTYSTPNAANDWLIAPAFAMNAGQTYNVSFKYRVGLAAFPEKFQVYWVQVPVGSPSPTGAMLAGGTQIYTTTGTGVANTAYATMPTTLNITPPTSGNYYVGIYINSVADQFLLAIDDFSVTTVACPTPPTVTSTPAASALPYTVGTAITSITMSATPTATYTYSITAGALPAGVTMTTAGVISGTPTTAAASGTFTVTATNTTNGACTGIKPFTFSVACPTLTVDSTPTPTALTLVVNTAMSNITMSTLGATGTFVYAITAGALPTGVTMSAGVISGTPSVLTASGTFTVTSTYGTNCTATKVFTYSVVSCPVNFTPATGATLTAGTLNVAYPATTISQSGISGTVTFSATGLPTPMVISSGGIITGTPTVGGTFTVVVSATNTPVTCAASATYTLVIACPVATLTIPAAANNGNVGIAYSATVTVPSGFTATGFTATGLPTGFSISSAGVIMGTATAASSGLVSITATAANGCTATGSYTLAITCPAITFIPVAGTLAAGTVGVAYTASVTPSIGTVTATGLPAGVTMTTAGAISGAPTAAGSFTVVVSAVVGTCPPVTSNYTIVVACPTITFTPATGALAGGSIGTPYTASVSASPIGTTLTATGLPAGLTMTSAGAISGTPTGSPATASVVVTATFGTCPVVTSNYTIVIACPTITLTPATGALAGGSIGSAYTASISVSPSGTTLAATGLPAGLTMTSAGAISGTPTGSPATANVVVTATFGTCPTATSNYTIVIGATLCTTVNITQTTLPNGTVGSIYAPIQLTATGGSSNTVFTFTPANAFATTGLSMSSTGLISGTPTLSTSVTVLITATNGTPCSGTRSLTLVTVPNPATAINGTLSSEVKVYPNPSKADFNVDFANLNLGKVAIRVYDVQGKQVFTTSTSDNTTVISLEKFAKGMYLLEIESQKGRILKRIVKE